MRFDEKERIMKSVMEQIGPEIASQKRARMKKVASTAAIIAIVLVLGACAVKVLHLDSKIAAVIGGSNEALDSAAYAVDASCEKNGIRIDVKQAMSDGQKLYISFDVVSLTELTFEYDNAFRDHYLQEEGIFWDWGRIYAVSPVSEDGKTLSLSMEVEAPLEEGTHNLKLSLTDLLENFTTKKVIAEGTWEVEFEIVCGDLTKIYYSNDSIEKDGIILDIKQIVISLVNCKLEFRLNEGSPKPSDEWWSMRMWENVMFIMENGEEIMFINDDGAGWHDDGDAQWGWLGGSPAQIIDPEKLAAISFDGEVIELDD